MSDEHLVRAHQNWLGILRPEGLVVASRALVEAQAILETNAAGERVFLEDSARAAKIVEAQKQVADWCK